MGDELLIFCEELSEFSKLKSSLLNCGYKNGDIHHFSHIDLVEKEELKLVSPALIFSKISERDKKNLRMLKNVAKVFPRVPVVAVCNYFSEDQALKCIKYGAIDYLNIDDYSFSLLKKTINLSLARKKEKRRLSWVKEESRRLFTNNPQPMWLYDLKTTHFLKVNKAAVEKYGYSKAEFMQMSIKDIRPEEDLEKLKKSVGTTGKVKFSYRGLWRHITKSGRLLYVDIVSYKTVYKEKKAVMVIAMDVTEKYLAIKEKEKNELKVIKTLESISEGFIALDKKWVVTRWNRSAEKMLGIGREEILQKNIRETFGRTHYNKLYEECRKVMKTGKTRVFEFYDAVRGRWFGVKAFPTSEGLAVYINDITREVVRKRELNKIRANHDALINASKEAVWSIDRDLNLTAFNKAFVHFIEHLSSAKVKLGKPVFSLTFPEELKAKWHNYYLRALKGESFEIIEEYADDRGEFNGTGVVSFNPITNAEDGTIEGVACFSKDITEMRRTQEKLELSEKRFRSLVQEGSDIISILDDKGNYIYASPTSPKNIRMPAENFIGKNVFDFIHEEDRETARKQFKSVKKGQSLSIKPFRFMGGDGNWRWAATILTNLLEEPSVGGIIANSRDITERILAEQEREKLIRDLKKYNQELLQFSYITSHNLRGPLSNLLALTQMIDKSAISHRPTLKLIEAFTTSTHHLNETVNDLLDVLVIKDKKKVEIQRLDLQQHWDLVERNLSEDVKRISPEIHTDFSAAPQVVFNRLYLDSLFLNLLSNALRYRSPNRKLVLNISSIRKDDKIMIEFSDNGLGIDLALHGKKIFGLYQRFHSHIEGKGLGLFLIKSQITSMGGSIEVESEPDRGTRFFIQLTDQM